MDGIPARISQAVVVIAALVVVGGCQNRAAGPSQPSTTVRSEAQTAPADLQLTCSSEASTRLGVQNALPVSSSLAQPDLYRVDLNAGGTTAVCMIKSDGTVVSVEKTG